MTRDILQQHVNELFGLEMFTLLYMSVGSGRGQEVKSLPIFEEMQVVFGAVLFTMTAKKGERHGSSNQTPVEHYAPPSLTRCLLVLHLCLYPALKNVLNEFDLDMNSNNAKELAVSTFKLIFNLTDYATVGSYIARNLIIQMINYSSNFDQPVITRVSTSSENAIQFHHKPKMHDNIYSSATISKDKDGNRVGASLITARAIWRQFGEGNVMFNRFDSDNDDNTIPDAAFISAMRQSLRNPSAECKPFQMKAFKELDRTDGSQHLFVFQPPGSGKSALWNILILARYLYSSKIKKSLVIIPHNALLAQQQRNSREKYFYATSVRVVHASLENLQELIGLMGEFDLCYISIHAFATLISKHRGELMSWGLDLVFIDEYHLLFSEIFRVQQWASIQDIVSLEARIICTSATTCTDSIKCTASFLGIKSGNYTVIGGHQDYTVPNIAIHIKESKEKNLIREVGDYIKRQIAIQHQQQTKHSLHVIAFTRKQATNLSTLLLDNGISSTSLTSDNDNSSRVEIMNKWAKGTLHVLVSTFNCGLDSEFVGEVIIMGGCRSAADAQQSMGRIRPQMQKGEQSLVTFWLSELSWTVKEYANEDDLYSVWVANHLFDAYQTDDEKKLARRKMMKLYHQDWLKNLLVKFNRICIRKELLLTVEVPSNHCKLCFRRCQKNAISTTETVAALNRHNNSECAQDKVLKVLTIMTTKCYVCSTTTCDGMGCIKDHKNHCFKCLGYTGRMIQLDFI